MATRAAAPPAPPRRRAGAPASTAGLLPASLLATLSLLVLPGATVALVAAVTGAALTGPAGWAMTGLVSLAYMLAGAKLWARHPRSEDLSWGELVLWSWARRRLAEGTLARSAGLLDDDAPVCLDPQSRREQLKVLRELNAALEVRDPYTRGHARRVERHAHRIALALRCSDDDIFDVRLAASLHDVGKIKVPDRVLRKDGPLDDAEWAVMKMHSEVGAELVQRLGNHEVVAAVRSHHERWDGRGYPDGLSGNKIPLGARIIAVADTFDAITSCRPYRNRSDNSHAIAVLKEESGKQFDPAVVSAFLSVTPHKAAAFAGLAALVAPVARKVASQWGVALNKAGAVSLAGTMTASAFTGVAAVERPLKERLEGRDKRAAARSEVTSDAAPAAGEASETEGAPSPAGNAFGHDKKAHEGGNRKSHSGGNGKSKRNAFGHAGKADEAKGGESHAGGNGKSHAGGNGKSKAPVDKPSKPEKQKPEKPGKTAAPGKPEKAAAAGGAAEDEAAPGPKAPAPDKEPKPAEPAEPAAPAAPEAPAQPAPEPAEEPAPAPGKVKDKANGKSK